MFHHISSMIFIYDIHLWIYDIHLHMVHIPKKKEKEKHAPYLPSRQASRVHQWRLRIYGAATCHFLRTSLVSQKSNRQEDKSKEHHISYQNRDTSVFFPFLMLSRGCSKVKYHQISGMMWRELLSKVAISHCVRMMKIWSTRLLQSISEGVIRGTVPSSRNPIIRPKSCGHTYLGLLASLWVSGRWFITVLPMIWTCHPLLFWAASMTCQ